MKKLKTNNSNDEQVGLLEIKIMLEGSGIYIAKFEYYQNRFLIRIPVINPVKYRIILNSISNIYAIEEDIYLKMDLKWWEKFYILITGKKYWYKDYR